MIYSLPEYYTTINGKTFKFPDMKSFLSLERFKPELNRSVLPFYLCHGMSCNEQTLLNGVYRKPPKLTLHYSGYEGETAIDWWAKEFWGRLCSVVEAFAKNKKVGVLLSGGLDSAIVAAALKQCGITFTCYTLGGDEAESAQELVEYLKMHIRTTYANLGSSFDIGKELTYFQSLYDEPLIKFTFIPTFYLVNSAKDEVDILFTGDGGDELFIGYRKDYWNDPLVVSIFSKLGILRKPLLILCDRLVTPLANSTHLKQLSLASEFFERPNASDSEWRYRIASRVFQPYLSETDLKCIMLNNTINTIHEVSEAIMDTPLDKVEAISHAMLKGELYNDMFRVWKSMSVVPNIEFCSPLLEELIVDFATSIPISFRYRNGITKYFLRYVAEHYAGLPEFVYKQKAKVGLSASVYEWLNNPQHKCYFQSLLSRGCDTLGLNRGFLHKVFPPRTYTQSLKAWNLVGLSLWADMFLRR